MRKHIYNVHLKEFLKLLKCLASSDIYTIAKWLDLLFNVLHQERKKRNERIPTRLLSVYMGQSNTFVVLHLLLSLFSPICLSSSYLLSLNRIIISFSFYTWYQNPNLGILVMALDHLVAPCALSLLCFGGPLLSVSLNQLYLSYLRSN